MIEFSKERQLERLKRPTLKSLNPLLSEIVELKAYNSQKGYSPCWICGKQGNQAVHIFSKKAYPRSRFDIEDNVKWACFPCHKGNRHSMHEDPEWFRKWYCREFGISAWENLSVKVHLAEATSKKLDTIMIKFQLQEEIKRLKEIKNNKY